MDGLLYDLSSSLKQVKWVIHIKALSSSKTNKIHVISAISQAQLVLTRRDFGSHTYNLVVYMEIRWDSPTWFTCDEVGMHHGDCAFLVSM